MKEWKLNTGRSKNCELKVNSADHPKPISILLSAPIDHLLLNAIKILIFAALFAIKVVRKFLQLYRSLGKLITSLSIPWGL